jgi:predicted RecB family nuclease
MLADEPSAPPDPSAEQRIADAAAHRAEIGRQLGERLPDGWVTVPLDASSRRREALTREAIDAGAAHVYNPQLPRDRAHGRRGRVELLIRHAGGYLPVLVARHRITDPGSGARTSPIEQPTPAAARTDPKRKVRAHPRDQLRLAHAWRMLEAIGAAANGQARGGVIGLDADVLLWHELESATWPGGRTALSEYDVRFADRLAIAVAADAGDPALAEPSRIMECRHCPWWPRCSAELTERRDVSLVLRGEEAGLMREAGVFTVDALAALDRADPSILPEPKMRDAVVLARAWLAGQTMIRRVEKVQMPRGDVEIDVDMESFGDSGAYLWGCLLTGVDIGVRQGYHPFVTWEALPDRDEARSFAEFWQWFRAIRARTAELGLTFRAYCYNELAENRWLLGSVDRFGDEPGIPPKSEIQSFIQSAEWVDEYRSVAEQFVCARGKGLKVVAPVAGFSWRDPEAGGENSMRWYRRAVGMDGDAPDAEQRTRLLQYNEDDVRATYALREWMSGPAAALPHVDDL